MTDWIEKMNIHHPTVPNQRQGFLKIHQFSSSAGAAARGMGV
ncbi:hypothetical protein ACTHRH_04925 [Paenibacillus sp. SAFN-117]|nr:hypothetical protein [Paenibacillus sp. 32O-W]